MEKLSKLHNHLKKITYFFFFLLSFLFVFSLIIPSSVKAASCSLVLDSVYICSNTPIITYPNDCFAGSTTYVGNWRFRARVRNAGTESVSGTYTVFSWPYSTVFTYDLTLGPSEFRDFNDTSTGWICDHIEFSADCDAGGGATTNFQLSGAGLCPGAPTPTLTPTPLPVALSGRIFNDKNNNGIYNAGTDTDSFDIEAECPDGGGGVWATSVTLTGPGITPLYGDTTLTAGAWRTTSVLQRGKTYIVTLNLSSGCSWTVTNNNQSVLIPLSGNLPFPRLGVYKPTPTRTPTPIPTGTIAPTPTPTTAVPTPTGTAGQAWFQAQGGNIYAGGLITNSLPAGEQITSAITDTASEGTTYYSGTLDVAPGETGRNVNSGEFPELMDYQSLLSRFSGTTAHPLESEPSSINKEALSSDPGTLGNTAVYQKEGNLELEASWEDFTGNAVIFVDGTLTINTPVTVSPGSFLGFVVKGDISISEDVGTSQADATSNIEGFYFTDGTFSTGTGVNPSVARLNLSGTYAAIQGFSLQRDLTAGGNSNYPAETFQYRPDFAFSAPRQLHRPYRYYTEEIP